MTYSTTLLNFLFVILVFSANSSAGLTQEARQKVAADAPWSLQLDSGWTLTPADTGGDANNASSKQLPEALTGGIRARGGMPVPVPSAWESFLGEAFDGVSVYHRTISESQTEQINRSLASLASLDPHELLITFDGVATDARVYCNDVLVGQHLGAWTRWSCSLEKAWKADGENHIAVLVDEKVGHHTQGFLPVFAPHFGGIWQPVRLEIQPKRRIDANRSMVLGRFSESGEHFIELELVTSGDLDGATDLKITVDAPALETQGTSAGLGDQAVAAAYPQVHVVALTREHLDSGIVRLKIPVPEPRVWSPEQPWLYSVTVALRSQPQGSNASRALDTKSFRTGIRSVKTIGDQLFLNGEPLVVRGVLNWGYAPPSTAPSLDPNFMLNEITAAKRMGLNLMKFCLWIPPRDYLDLADEQGMLTWIEYPTWHAQLVDSNLEALRNEYLEFTYHDRSHPSTILRSLTCETGSSAELSVIQSLYDLVHEQVPDAIVEDDSSWISWNRVSDIWDDHPYGNNHTWVEKLNELKQFVADRDAKPLILGEAIAADTWPDLSSLSKKLLDAGVPLDGDEDASTMPFWLFNSFRASQVFEQQLRKHSGESVVERLRNDSTDYAYQMRKFQIETFRREVPWGGFVLSVIRDFPFAPMGLLDSAGDFKFPAWDASKNWSAADPLLILESRNDRRSFQSGTEESMKILMANAAASHQALNGESIDEGEFRIRWELRSDDSGEAEVTGSASLTPPTPSGSRNSVGSQASTSNRISATSADHYQTEIKVPFPAVSEPQRFELVATLTRENAGDGRNNVLSGSSWKLWVIPSKRSGFTKPIVWHSSVSEEEQGWIAPIIKSSQTGEQVSVPENELKSEAQTAIVVASRFDSELLDQLLSGARILMLPDGEPGSFPTREHWFLRGGPIVFPSDRTDGNLLADLQHFDLAGPVQYEFDFWQETDPLLLLWDSHDIAEVKTHGLVWEARVGSGQLLVSMLNHAPSKSSAGPYLLSRLLNRLADTEAPERQLSTSTISRLRASLGSEKLDLSEFDWRFIKDPRGIGLTEHWFQPAEDRGSTSSAVATRDPFSDETESDNVSEIRIGRHWEGDHPGLDGWAWYALDLEIPENWESDELYLCFTGVDDHYQAFVNGQRIGEAGDIEKQLTAFEMRTSHRLPSGLRAGDTLRIRIAVYDWYGAGGIFRPVFLRTRPLPNGPPLLRE